MISSNFPYLQHDPTTDSSYLRPDHVLFDYSMRILQSFGQQENKIKVVKALCYTNIFLKLYHKTKYFISQFFFLVHDQITRLVVTKKTWDTS